MVTLKKKLLTALEHLGKEDFEEFKWHLQQKVLGCEGIPKSRLEDACRTQTVDHMFLNYCINTIKVTRNVLKEMNQNLLEEKLSEITSEPTGQVNHNDNMNWMCPPDIPHRETPPVHGVRV
ncbi:Pyrin [Dissostichus eleginoides]|uniref:Pyrin n=1 Tax=Dissostichus eleginoides TaxID=100907 RepID=A0AAD9B1L5_DISEL|nr:Pyrin [Dissostichus eleginoides]